LQGEGGGEDNLKGGGIGKEQKITLNKKGDLPGGKEMGKKRESPTGLERRLYWIVIDER